MSDAYTHILIEAFSVCVEKLDLELPENLWGRLQGTFCGLLAKAIVTLLRLT
jgi:hypothetical protein